MKSVACCILFIAAMTACAYASRLSAAQTKGIDALVRQAMAEQHVAGAEIGIGRRGQLLYAHGYGLRDRERHLPVTSHTIFPVGSITKQFTATAAMLLVDDGRLNLDARISRYLPNAPHASEITVRELLDQTSGLPDYLENKPLLGAIMRGAAGPHPPERLLAYIKDKPLHFKPGTKYEYSNSNYCLVGMIVSRVSGMPYGQFLRQRVLLPQHLLSTQYLAMSVPQGPDVVRGYTYEKGRFDLLPRDSLDWGNAAGALASDAADLVTWDGAYFGGRVLPPRAFHTATTPPPHITMQASKDPANNLGGGYAFGWVQGHYEGRPLIWHNGGLPGARAMNLVFPGDGLEIVVLTNVTDAAPETIALRIARALYSTAKQ